MKIYAIPLVMAVAIASAGAQEVSNLQDAINRAVLQSPTVNASWHAYESAREGQRVGKGGYYPKVDLTAQGGEERQRFANGTNEWESYNPLRADLVLTQLLFDGFATSSEVKRLDAVRQLRYFEFISASQESALEAIRAYFDTLRFQKLVTLAKDNYIQHYNVFEEIEERTGAGVGREVDLEQANARLALSEANLLTEVTNLYDVAVRFERVIGDLPAETLEEHMLDVAMIPELRDEALATAYLHNPDLNAATRNIAAANAALKVRKAAMMPKLDLRIAKSLDDEVDNIQDQIHQEGIHLVLTYNLYNGGSDSARNRQFHEEANTARELRDKVCRDVKQEVLIAHNDIQSLEEQVAHLDRNQIAVGKAREAYRNQFNIGQRTLLDLLDTENEYFEVRRAYVNAANSLEMARVRTLSSMGRLLPSLTQVHRGADAGVSDPTEAAPCPIGGPSPMMIDKVALVSGLLADERFRQQDDGDLAFSMRAQFAVNSSRLTADYEKDIADGAAFLKQHPEVTAVLEGHTDSTGTDKYNQWLSDRRGKAVEERLIWMGIAPERLSVVGHGESQPLTSNETKEGRQLNRRVDMVMEDFNTESGQ